MRVGWESEEHEQIPARVDCAWYLASPSGRGGIRAERRIVTCGFAAGD